MIDSLMGGWPMLKRYHTCDTLVLDDGVHVLLSFIPWPNSKDGCNQNTIQIIPISQKEYVEHTLIENGHFAIGPCD